MTNEAGLMLGHSTDMPPFKFDFHKGDLGHTFIMAPTRIGMCVMDLARYHGRRDGGVYVPLFIDSRIAPSDRKRISFRDTSISPENGLVTVPDEGESAL